MTYETAPRPIHHDLYEQSQFGKIPIFAIAPICRHLTDGERRLFLYYATCKSGFAPSFREIYKNTGLQECNASRVRKRLRKKGFISFNSKTKGSNGPIQIRWNRIYEFAQRLERDDLIKSGVGVSATPITDNIPQRDLTIRQLHKQSRPRQSGEQPPARDMTKQERKFLNWSTKQTELELATVIKAWSKSKQEEAHQEEPLPF